MQKMYLTNKNIDSGEHFLSSVLFESEEDNLKSIIDFGENKFCLKSEFIFPLKNNQNKFSGCITRISELIFYPGIKEGYAFSPSTFPLPLDLINTEGDKDIKLVGVEKRFLFDDICLISKEKFWEQKADIQEDGTFGQERRQTFECWKTLVPNLIPTPNDNVKEGEPNEFTHELVLRNIPTTLESNGILRLEDNSTVKIISSNSLDPVFSQMHAAWDSEFKTTAQVYIAGVINQLLLVNYELYKNTVNTLSEEERERYNNYVNGYFGGSEQ